MRSPAARKITYQGQRRVSRWPPPGRACPVKDAVARLAPRGLLPERARAPGLLDDKRRPRCTWIEASGVGGARATSWRWSCARRSAR